MKVQFAHQSLSSGRFAGAALLVVACVGLASLPAPERVFPVEVESAPIVVQNKSESESLSVMLFLHRAGAGVLPAVGVSQ